MVSRSSRHRTKPWGYEANKIIAYLSSKGYEWFALRGKHDAEKLDVSVTEFDGNFSRALGNP